MHLWPVSQGLLSSTLGLQLQGTEAIHSILMQYFNAFGSVEIKQKIYSKQKQHKNHSK